MVHTSPRVLGEALGIGFQLFIIFLTEEGFFTKKVMVGEHSFCQVVIIVIIRNLELVNLNVEIIFLIKDAVLFFEGAGRGRLLRQDLVIMIFVVVVVLYCGWLTSKIDVEHLV